MDPVTTQTGGKPLEQYLVEELLKDRRRERFWRMVRWGGTMVVALVLFFVAAGIAAVAGRDGDSAPPARAGEPYAALVRLEGEIGSGSGATSERFSPALVRAFQDEKAAGVIIAVNSPGGTPVQASIIHDRILQLKHKHPGKRVVVVGEDMLTSGAYMVAVAADAIYVNQATLTGSIGVISRSFGFVDLMQKAGVEARVQTAGSRKDLMDPFRPRTEEDRAKLDAVLRGIHDQFIAIVKDGRKGKLKGEDGQLFTGEFWLGAEAVKLGLVDGLGSLAQVLETEFKVTRVREYRPAEPIWSRLARSVGGEVRALVTAYEPPLLLPR